MDQEVRRLGINTAWNRTPQIEALLAMADPAHGDAVAARRELDYMAEPKDFQKVKNKDHRIRAAGLSAGACRGAAPRSRSTAAPPVVRQPVVRAYYEGEEVMIVRETADGYDIRYPDEEETFRVSRREVIAAAVAVPIGIISEAQDFVGWLRAITGGASVVSALIALGQTPAFPCICRLPLIRKLFSDIDGRWEGALDSNWPQIAAMANLQVGNREKKPVTVQICARLLHVSLTLDTHDEYSKSTTKLVSISKNQDNGCASLWCIYDNLTKNRRKQMKAIILGLLVLISLWITIIQ